MLNRIIRFSLNNRYLIVCIFAIITLCGLFVVAHTTVDVFPDLNAPTVTVMTEAPGLAPEEVEKLVSYPIETAVNGATGVRRVRSTSDTGLSVVNIEFDWGTDIYLDRQIVSEKLSTVAESLPPNVKSPVMAPQTSIMGEVLIIGLTAKETSPMELRTLADRSIRPQLLSLPGVAQITVMGGDVKEYQVLLNPERMRALSVSMDDVIAATNQFNDNTNGSILHEYGNEYLVKGLINTSDAEKLEMVAVRTTNDNFVRLSDIAEVKIGSVYPKLGLATEKGIPAVLITVSKQNDVNTTLLIADIEESLGNMKKNLPNDVVVSTDIFRQSDFIDNAIDNIKGALAEGALFVVVILFLFLMDYRTTIISVIALPISVIITLIILHLLNLSINTMSLGGIAIAIGSLVDDAIVDVENVYRKLRENSKKPKGDRQKTKDIIFNASSEVRMPILNSTLIIVASFLPLFFLTGMEGRLLIPLGIAFIVSLAASTIVALTLTPVMCNLLLSKDKHLLKAEKESFVSRKLKALYQRSLQSSFNHQKSILVTITAIFIVALGLFFTLGRGFLPPFNEGSFTINVTALPGISLEESNKIGEEVDKILLSVPEIKTIARKTGRAELDEHSRGSNASEIEAPYELKNRSRAELAADIRNRLSDIPGVNIEIGQPISHRIDAMLSGTEAQIAIKIFGDDLSTLHNLATKIKSEIGEVEGIVDVNVEQQIQRPEVLIIPNRTLMAEYGITMPEFKQFVDVCTSGVVVSNVYEDGVPYDLRLKVADDKHSKMSEIEDLMIDTPKGKIPLSSVAEVKSSSTVNSINRENARRRIVISANVEDRDLVGAVDAIKAKIASSVKLPEGYYINYGGQFESEQSASKTLALTTILALLVILFLLYQEFHRISDALIILVNIPLAMIGGVLILWINGRDVNIPAIIGFISLLGIATRNGMLLISHYRQLEKEGLPLNELVLKGSMDRLLPIVMTALSSALALIPIVARGTEPGNEIQSPMALVILGGLLSSTLLNIFVVPIIYYMNNKKHKL